ncbi:hypothetical protein E2320_006338, partial [Naja naja]
MGCSPNCGLITVATIGAVLAVLGAILIPVGNHFIDKTVEKEVVIENGTIAYQNWVLPGSPIYREFWVFDVQNPEDQNITEHKDATLSYLQPNIFIFQPDMSAGPENDTFTTVNLAVVTAPVLYKNGFMQFLMDIWMRSAKSKLLQTRTVKEILWGYEDPFLKKIPIIKIDKVVGIFYPYNNTFDAPYEIHSGKDDINKKGIITTYNNSSIPPSAFASAFTNPDNICFCTERVVSRNCTTRKPVYISLPHFLHGSQRIFQFVKGMEPNITGFTLAFSKRLQVNLLVQNNPKITALKNIKHRFYFPVLWLNETAIITDEKAEFFRSKVTNKIKLLNLLQLTLMIVGSVMFLGFLFAFFMCKGKSQFPFSPCQNFPGKNFE